MTQQILRVSDETTLAELTEALGNLNTFAKRQQCVVGDSKGATAWDRAHRKMDGLLDEINARDGEAEVPHA